MPAASASLHGPASEADAPSNALCTRLDADQARLKAAEHCKQLITANLPAQNRLARVIDAVKLKNVLGDIQPYPVNLHADGPFLQVAI
jgi:hypothetical protein